jgi:hypothetical protein
MSAVGYDLKVSRSDVSDRAWEQVRRNRGAAGIDEAALADIEGVRHRGSPVAGALPTVQALHG